MQFLALKHFFDFIFKEFLIMGKQKTTSPEKQLELEAIASKFSGENSYSQRARFLEALSRFPVTTFEAMRYLDIYDPRPRIHELRHKYGYGIKTLRQTAVTESGEKHSIGLYVLESSANQPSVKH
jgi:Helix-turn-helix domain